MHLKWKLSFSLAVLTCAMNATAATLIDLKDQNTNILQSFMGTPSLHAATTESSMKEVSRFTDFNQTVHIRVQEFYRGYAIWNAHAVIHIPAVNKNQTLTALLQPTIKKSMNGKLYQQLNADLDKAPSSIFTESQANQALQLAIATYKDKAPNSKSVLIKNPKSQLLVFVDSNQAAHWAYKVAFDVPAGNVGQLPAKPNYIIDAVNLKVYQSWDDIKTIANVHGGGFGGNAKHKLTYDGLSGNLAALDITREAGICYLQNDEIKVTHYVTNDVMHYACAKPNKAHNYIYWSADFDAANEAYSPANDAMFAAQVIKHFYKEWYHLQVLTNPDHSEMQLHMVVHVPKLDNAFWDGEKMTFGDGQELYPLTSLGIAAHEVSHGFTQQHADLQYNGQSGGMNESFSDMAGATAEYYAYGKSSWQIGAEIFKIEDESMRFFDQPSKDCYGKEPGTSCSIDRADQYYEGLNVHFSSGVYNRAFYLLSTTPDWNPRKAFEVMVQANASYWTPVEQYADGAACVVKAAQDLHYDASAVEQAFKAVGIVVPTRCTNA